MSEEILQDDQSHYEISLTGAQAFVAFVLLLLSLSASFAFGLMIGKGQADSRLVVQREPAVVTEANITGRSSPGRIVELGVAETGSSDAETSTAPAETATEPAPVVVEEAALTDTAAPAASTTASPEPAEVAAPPVPAENRLAAQYKVSAQAVPAVPHYAQLISTGDQKTAENLAARLIDNGFTSAYVERGTTEKGPIYRVRVKFGSEPEARAAEARLRTFSKDVWITK